MAARSFALPGTFEEPARKPLGDLARPVIAAVEDNDDFVGKAQTSETFGQLALLVMDNDEGREAGPPQPIQAAALAIDPHSRRAAISAASTERPSISVSVVR